MCVCVCVWVCVCVFMCVCVCVWVCEVVPEERQMQAETRCRRDTGRQIQGAGERQAGKDNPNIIEWLCLRYCNTQHNYSSQRLVYESFCPNVDRHVCSSKTMTTRSPSATTSNRIATQSVQTSQCSKSSRKRHSSSHKLLQNLVWSLSTLSLAL